MSGMYKWLDDWDGGKLGEGGQPEVGYTLC